MRTYRIARQKSKGYINMHTVYFDLITPFVLFFQILSLLHTSEAVLSFQCPLQSHWRHREKTYCNSSSSYFCLYDLNENSFTEMCREESEIEKAGIALC